jgi:hypothetical protein
VLDELDAAELDEDELESLDEVLEPESLDELDGLPPELDELDDPRESVL